MQFDQRLTGQFADQPETVQHGLQVKVTVLHLVSLNTYQQDERTAAMNIASNVTTFTTHVGAVCCNLSQSCTVVPIEIVRI